MLTHIVIHLMPHELDHFEWQSKQFKLGSAFLSDNDKILIDATLNFNLVDWDESKLSKDFFINKFNQIKELWDWAETKFDIDENNICCGCNDKRRNSIRSSTADNILYLDSDIIFKPELLKYILDAANAVPNEYYIISPQVYKLWDNSWDCLVNDKFINLKASQDYTIVDPYTIISHSTDDITIKPINEFKFGGGWFNLLSTNLLKLTDIPNSIGPYGIDDTYVMICCGILKQKGYDVCQYILEGMIVAENLKYRKDPYTNFLYSINKKSEFRLHAENNLQTEINKFITKL
jgi:hypothetical protein